MINFMPTVPPPGFAIRENESVKPYEVWIRTNFHDRRISTHRYRWVANIKAKSLTSRGWFTYFVRDARVDR